LVILTSNLRTLVNKTLEVIVHINKKLHLKRKKDNKPTLANRNFITSSKDKNKIDENS